MTPTARIFSLFLLLPVILASTIPPPSHLFERALSDIDYADFDRTLDCGDRGVSQRLLDHGNAQVPNDRPFTREDFGDSLTRLCNYNSNPALGNAACYCAGIPSVQGYREVSCLPFSSYVPQALWSFQLYCKMQCLCNTRPRYKAEDAPAPKIPVPFPIGSLDATKPFAKVYGAPDGKTWSYEANGWVSDGSSSSGGTTRTSHAGDFEDEEEEAVFDGGVPCDNAELGTYDFGTTQRQACGSCGTTCRGQADCVAASFGASGCHCYVKSVVSSQLLLGVEGGVTSTVKMVGVCALSLAASKKLKISVGLGGRDLLGGDGDSGDHLPAAASTAAVGVVEDDEGAGMCRCNSTFTSSACCRSHDGLVWDVQSTLLMPLQ